MLRFPTKSTLTPKLPLAPKPLQLPLAPKLQRPLVECFPRGAGDEDPDEARAAADALRFPTKSTLTSKLPVAYTCEVVSQGSRGPGTARQGEVAPCHGRCV